MVFSYNWLKQYIKGRAPEAEKLAALLTKRSFEVEEVKKKGKDWLLSIDILPDRASDCFSHIGLAREIAAITDSRLKELKIKIKEDKKKKIGDFIAVEVKNRKDCLRYTIKIIDGIKVGPAPEWIKERLESCGINSINNIVDIANYVMLETGQPLHVFDFDKIKNVKSKIQIKNQNLRKIIVRRAKKGEKITTLDNKKYDLDEDVLVIADSENPLAIAGIKGGKKAEITKNVKTIVLESANFDYQVIRRASKKLFLKTDASCRFENGIDPNLTEKAINRAADLIQKTAGGKIIQGTIDFYPKKVVSKKIILRRNYLEKLLGVKISEKEIRKILEKLGFETQKEKSLKIKVKVPTFRLDISLEENLIEEVGRIYGYENIPLRFPVSSLIPPKKNFDVFWENFVKDILKECGFSEIYNYSFIGDKEADNFNYKKEELIEVKNPVSLEQRYLRPSLIPGLLKNVESNLRFFSAFKIFELGKIFKKVKERKITNFSGVGAKSKTAAQKLKINEKKMLNVLAVEKEKANELFYYLKGVADSLLNKLGISDIWYDEYQPTSEENKGAIWNLKKSAEIKIGSEEIGFLGTVSRATLAKLKIKEEVVLLDINFEKLIKLASEEREYQPISRYPAAVRDLAVLTPLKTKVAEVLNKINVVGGALVRDIDVFDIYEGEEIPEGKKNLAFHIIYQAKNRTLSFKEIEGLQQKIIKALEENPEWEARK